MRPLLLAFALIAFLGSTGPAFAWGQRGHVLIAELAYGQLTPAARHAVDALVAEDFSASPGCPIHSFSDAALWSDCVRQIPSYRNQSAWHYDNIPLCGAANYDVYCANGNCATAAIGRALRTLRNSQASSRDRQRALARLVHIIGDIHQPLHAVNNGDRGGNDVGVSLAWPGASSAANLHAAWDSALVDYALGADRTTDATALAQLTQLHASEWSTGNARDWAAEAHRAAVDVAYGGLPVPATCGAAHTARIMLDARYAERAAPVVRLQLARASVRLAVTLNAALGQ